MIRIAHVDDVPPGECKVVDAGGRELALCNVDGRYHALDNACPHQGGPLGFGFLDGTTLICPLHGWTFDLTTGQMPGEPRIKVGCYPVVVQGEDVLVEL